MLRQGLPSFSHVFAPVVAFAAGGSDRVGNASARAPAVNAATNATESVTIVQADDAVIVSTPILRRHDVFVSRRRLGGNIGAGAGSSGRGQRAVAQSTEKLLLLISVFAGRGRRPWDGSYDRICNNGVISGDDIVNRRRRFRFGEELHGADLGDRCLVGRDGAGIVAVIRVAGFIGADVNDVNVRMRSLVIFGEGSVRRRRRGA